MLLTSRLAADPGFSAALEMPSNVFRLARKPSGFAIANSPGLMIGSLGVESLFMGCAALSRISSTSQEQLYWVAGIDEGLAPATSYGFVYIDTVVFISLEM